MNYERLSAVLRVYDASFDTARLKAIYDGEQATALAEWAQLHLTPDTLLTHDELQQFTALTKAAKVEQLSGSTDLGDVQALNDQEIKDAIQELKRSTEAIAKQTETLRQQQDALGRLVNGTKRDAESRSNLEMKHGARREASQKSTAWAVEDLTQRLHLQITELESQKGGDGNRLKKIVDDLLRSDDKLLTSLQKLSRELETEDPQEQENLAKLREVCARLIKYTVEGIRTKLDRRYLESLGATSRPPTEPQEQVDDATVAQEELESLYAEILPVAQMSVEQQYLQPALKGLAARNGNSLVRSEQAAGYIQECLDYLLGNMDAISQRVDEFQSHQVAVSSLLNTAKAEQAAKVDSIPKRERQPTIGASPVRRRKSSTNLGGMSPFRPRSNSHSRRRSSGGSGAEEPPYEELLRTLALSMPNQGKPSASETQAQAAFLASTLDDRISKANDVALNVQQSFEGAATTQMADARLAVQMVRDSILAESPYGEVRLADPEIDSSIAVLAGQLGEVKASFDSQSKNLASARGRSVKKEEFIRRWGS